MCSNKKNSEKIIHWIIIDDNESVLKNISVELTDSGINGDFIHCFIPDGQVGFDRDLQGNKELWLKFDGDTYDWDYKIKSHIEREKTLFELIKDIENKSNVENLYFVFILDILYQEDCNFCGFDLYRAIRWHVNPEHYIVRFLSHLSRSLIEEFIENEYQNLKLGREVKKGISKEGTRLKANNYYRIDLGFYSKAGYRKDISRSSNVDDIKINIINHDIIDNIKETFPRDISYNDIFWLYNNIYPVLKVCEDKEEDISYVVNDGKKLIDISSVKYNNKNITRESIFKSRWKFLKLCYNIMPEDKRPDIIKEIGLFNQTNNSFKFNITGEDTDKKMLSKRLHFECEWMGKEYTLKSPLYRQEVLRLYNLLNDPEKKVIDILFIGDKVDVKLANSIVNDELVDNVNDIKDLQTIVGKTRPKYIIVNQADDNNNTILKTIKEVILSIPNFEIHGFGVYFIANYWQEKGIPQSCLLNIKDGNKICIVSPISPVFSKLLFLSYIENPLDTLRHDLLNKENLNNGEWWDNFKIWMANLLDLKSMYSKKDEFKKRAEIIRKSEYNKEHKKWLIENKEFDIKDFLKELNLEFEQEKIHWILITDNDNFEGIIKKELERMAANSAISNNLEYTDKDFTCWMFSDIDKIGEIKEKLDELKQIHNSQFVFMFDSKVPILQYKKGGDKEFLQTAIQYIAERMKRESITFRILFTYNSQSEREEFFSERKYLQIEEYKAIDELNNIENRLVKRIKEEQKDLLKGITEEQKILVKGIKDELDKRMKDVVSAKQLFLFYPSEMKEDKIEIIGPDVLYFIRKDLKNCYSLNKELWEIFDRKKIPNKDMEDTLKEFYEKIIFFFNEDKKKYETNNINCQCNWTGYSLKEQDNINFFKDRLRLISKYIVLKLNIENYNELYDDSIFDEMKRYKLSCYNGNIRWNNLFEHEKNFLICKAICVIINKEKKKIEDEKKQTRV